MKITQAVPAVFAALAALTMKTIITSNWRPLRPALCTLLLGIAALWAMPRSARAQLYVTQQTGVGSTVGEYNATTGAAINANFITGLDDPYGLALSGNNLFVACQFSNTVGEYNATTGVLVQFPINGCSFWQNDFLGSMPPRSPPRALERSLLFWPAV